MPSRTSNSTIRKRLRQVALARWDDEGGAGPTDPDGTSVLDEATGKVPALTNAELVQLQIRVIALENLVIALLADSSESRRESAREMAAYISPRPGFTRHRLTLHAATQMTHLVDRAEQFGAASSMVEKG